MKVDRLDHLVFAVEEMVPALQDWAHAFDLQAEPPERPAGTHMELAFLPVGDAFMELVQATSPDHRVAKHVAGQGEGMFSISLEVADLDAAVRDLRSKDVPVSDPEPGVLPDTRISRIPRAAAHGTAVQLIERKHL